MTTVPYVILTDSAGYVSKRFRIPNGMYSPILDKKVNIQDCLDGDIDVQMGSVRDAWQVTFRVRETEIDSNFGTKDDLEYFYRLVAPNGVLNNLITMTDFWGAEHDVYLVGPMPRVPLTTILEGVNAWFHLGVTIRFKNG